MANSIAQTPESPYFAVIFTSQRTEANRGYGSVSNRMMELAAQQPGFLGVESVRDGDGFGITVSWRSLDDISAWRSNSEHLVAQETGKRVWYSDYQLRICEVQRSKDEASNPEVCPLSAFSAKVQLSATCGPEVIVGFKAVAGVDD